MKVIIFSVLTITLFTSLSFDLKAQSIDSLNQETILKSWNANNPYSKTQTRWLEKKGFQTTEYSWDNIGINSHIDKVFKMRETGVGYGLVSLLSVVLMTKTSHDKRNLIIPVSTITGIIALERYQAANLKIKKTEGFRKSLYNKNKPLEILTNSENKLIFSKLPVLPSPYSSSQDFWLSRNYFSETEYNWQDPEINEKIEKGFELRKEANLLALSPIGFVLGYLAYLNIRDYYTGNWKKENASQPNQKIIYASIGIPLIVSLIVSGQAKKKIREAEYLRSSKY